MDIPAIATFFSGVSFLFFGFTCLTTDYMKSEFVRYGYARERPLTGVLQMIAGVGLIAGFYASPLLAAAAAGGLSLMMTYGFYVRMKIKDTLLMATPAFSYAVLNLYLAIHYANVA
ncbi:MAG: DoxX family protein [Saprospiraceae bacterium]